MGRRHAADRDPGGGERISPSRARTRLGLAATAVLAASGVAVYGALAADRAGLLVLALGLGSAALLVFGLAALSPPTIVAALAGVAASWSVSAWTRGAGAPGGTILAAVGIFVAAELAYWSLEQVSVRDEAELVARRAAGLALRAALALALVAFALAALDLRAGGGLLLETVGVAAAVGLLALVLVLARTGHESRTGPEMPER
ncbi:MAG: hypothetical protein ACJ74L_12360 [Gaiellaceae bacterium]